MEINKLEKLSNSIRKKVLEMSFDCGGTSHIGGGLSSVEIFAVLYGEILNFDVKNKNWDLRDRFILSKGHGVLPYFAALHLAGFFDEKVLKTYKTNDSHLISHPIMNMELGIESSNGSLGHGLSMAIGIAMASKKKNRKNNTFVLVGDGECNEGSIWEAAMCASHYKLNNLFAIIDYNKYQNDGHSDDILSSGDMVNKWKSFGWNTVEIDGHNLNELYNSLKQNEDLERPKAIVAHTIKGKGISFMENNNEWHHNRLTQKLFDEAINEIKNI